MIKISWRHFQHIKFMPKRSQLSPQTLALPGYHNSRYYYDQNGNESEIKPVRVQEMFFLSSATGSNACKSKCVKRNARFPSFYWVENINYFSAYSVPSCKTLITLHNHRLLNNHLINETVSRLRSNLHVSFECVITTPRKLISTRERSRYSEKIRRVHLHEPIKRKISH